MPEIPFAHQWTIAENQLLPLKDSFYGCLCSTRVSNIPEFDYFLRIFPDKNDRQTWVFLQLLVKNVKMVYANYFFEIESANFSQTIFDIYQKFECRGRSICSTNEFFDPKKKFIVDGKVTVKVSGTFKFETENDAIPAAFDDGQQKWNGGKLGDELWDKNDTKDLKIITPDGKKINVHRFILANRSEIFNTTFDLKNGSAAEITNFPFKVVETGIKLIYECNFTSSLSLIELMLLFNFLNKFGLPSLKDDVEPILIAQISASSVVSLTNASIQTNSSKLNEKCMEFLMVSFESKTALSDIKYLNKDVALKILEISSETDDNTTTSDVVEIQQKWEGSYLGDNLWNHHETKDFTIFVDGEEIKAHKFILGVQSQMFKEISKETNKNEAEITDFSFNVVETGVKLIYDCNFTTNLSIEELMELQHFFDKNQLPKLKDKIEPLLIDQISPTTIVRLTNDSILTDSLKLKEKCITFLMAAFQSKTPLSDIKILDKDIALQILENSLYELVETED